MIPDFINHYITKLEKSPSLKKFEVDAVLRHVKALKDEADINLLTARLDKLADKIK
jgi:ubiquinone biosynthesis protein UbiJ